jgi:DNA-binding beta-propeller fold protein YncE
MHRRDFLRSSAAAGVTVAAGPILLGASEDKAGTKAAVVGTGEHTYECVHDWGQLPASIQWQTTHGVAVDSAGLVYVTHQGAGKDVMDTVVVFDPQGKYVRSFGKEYHGGGHGIDIRKEGGEEFIYLSHMSPAGPVVKTTLTGEVVWKKGPPPEAGVYTGKAIYKPTNVAFLPDGGFYVGDGYGSHYIHQFDKAGTWVRTFGGPGKDAGKLQTPHGLWLDARPGREPSLVVADRANKRLQYFTLDGKHLSFENSVLFPANIDTRGGVMLVSDLHARITLYGPDNKVLAHLGDDEAWRKEVLDGFKVRGQPAKWRAGKFVHPHDACFDAAGNIYVAEWVSTGRVSLLKKVG